MFCKSTDTVHLSTYKFPISPCSFAESGNNTKLTEKRSSKAIFTFCAVVQNGPILRIGQEQLDPEAEDKGAGKGNEKSNTGCAIKIHLQPATKFKVAATMQPLCDLQKCALHYAD